MQAFVRKLYNDRYYLIGGTLESLSESSPILGEYTTRREAIRKGRQQGYEIIINRRTKESEVTKDMDKDSSLKIRLAKYDMYNSGNIGAVWLNLPATADELATALDSINVHGGEHGIDYFITDFESSLPLLEKLHINVVRGMSIDELNYIAGTFERNAQRNTYPDLDAISQVAESIPLPVSEIPEDYRIERKNLTVPQMAEMAGQLRMYDAVAASVEYEDLTPHYADYEQDILNDALAKLKSGIKSIFDSDKYKSYLDTLSKFHRYSYNNCLLIAMQKPNATYVAGRCSWHDNFNRKIIDGEEEQGIKIIAPDYDTSKLRDRSKPLTFKVVEVYDISQTHGEPLRTFALDKLHGNIDRFDELYKAIEKSSPVPVTFSTMNEGTNGYFDVAENRIYLNENLNQQHKLRTLVHEIVHARLHNMDKLLSEKGALPDKATREIQAEGIAYAVCKHLGLDTSGYSFGYLAAWSSDKELPELRSSLSTISKGAKTLINEIDGELREVISREMIVETNKQQKAEQKAEVKKTAAKKPAAKSTAAKNTTAKKATTATAKKTAVKKPGVRSKLEAAKQKSAALAKNAPAKSKSTQLEVP